MRPSHIFAFLLALGYVGARLLLGTARITGRTRHFFLLGGEYIVLGALLGPSALGWISPAIMRELEPALAMGIGWLGLLYGLQFGRDHLRRFPPGPLLAAVAIPIGVAILLVWPVSGALQAIVEAKGPIFLTTLVLVAAATCTSPMAIALMARGQRANPSLTYLLRIISALDAAPAIVAVGIAYAILQPTIPGAPGLAAGLGAPLVLGLFYHRFLRLLSERSEMLLVTVGVICFVGGSAFSTSVSPLFSSFLIGVLLANLPGPRVTLLRLLVQTEKPFYIVFLILAGTRWDFAEPNLWLFGLIYVAMRLIAKVMVPYVASFGIRDREDFPPALGLGLLGQGGLAIAIALEADLLFPSQLSRAALAAVIVSILVHQVVAPLGLRLLFRGAAPPGRVRGPEVPL